MHRGDEALETPRNKTELYCKMASIARALMRAVRPNGHLAKDVSASVWAVGRKTL